MGLSKPTINGIIIRLHITWCVCSKEGGWVIFVPPGSKATECQGGVSGHGTHGARPTHEGVISSSAGPNWTDH